MVSKPRKFAAPLLTGLALCMAIPLGLSSSPAMAGSKTTITREVSDFDTIRLSGDFEGTVVVSDSESLTITGSGDLDERVTSEVRGNELRVGLSSKRRRHGTIVLAINAESLEKFIIEGAGKFNITGIDSEDFEVKLPGAATIDLSGECDDLRIIIAGAAHVDAKHLICKTGKVRISGAGTVTVHTSEEIDARVSGIGKIGVYGDPEEIDQHISGLGKIKLHK